MGAPMETYLSGLPQMVDRIRGMKETILANIVLIGQVPSPTFQEKRRAEKFMRRLVDFHVDECSTDGFRNPIGIIRGTDESLPPIFLVAHLDTFFGKDVDHNYTVMENTVIGAGVLDNTVSVGVMASFPEILRALGVAFKSTIVLAGVIQSLGKGNLRGIRHLVKTWKGPIRGAVIMEGVEIGRLNYYSEGMIRCEVSCRISEKKGIEHRFKPNAILILHDIINHILEMRLPQKPKSRIIIGKIAAGLKHGIIAYAGRLGFEIHSDSDPMVKEIYSHIQDIVNGISHEYGVELALETISNATASRLPYTHPLVKAAGKVMNALDIEPVGEPSESELSIFLAKKIPAVTLGLTRGEHFHQPNSKMEIDPMFNGIAQVVGVMKAIDEGVCDE
ncbi:MAG: M20/M25/M40 family metallo-hydrolase [Desulfobacterales bacterium]|jgi:di/tripeptidase